MTMQFPLELERVIREAAARGASDLFLLPGEPPAMRLHGLIERTDGDALTASEVRAWATTLIGDKNLARIGTEVGVYRKHCGLAGECSLSVSVARSHGDYTIVFRIMPDRFYTVEELHLPPSLVNAALSLNGLVVLAGPVGSGKTTSAYSLVDHINSTVDGCHICTVEGPSHMVISPKRALVQQREIGVDVPDALSGIQAAQEQDLDVLFVGELSNVEVLQACLMLTETGHLVITQMHTPTAEETLRHLLDAIPSELGQSSRVSLARTLRAISAQCLLPTADGKSQVAAYDLLIPDEEMRQSIAAGQDFMSRRTPWPVGCLSMIDHIEELRAQGVISDETAAKVLQTRRL